MTKYDFPYSHEKRIIPGFKVKPRSISNIERCAIQFLSKREPYFDIGEFFEFNLDDIGYALRVSEGLKEEAVTIFSDMTIVISGKVYESIKQPRNRFTLGHELGHAILHTDELGMREGAAARPINTANLKAYESSEWQANQFAGAILMPLSKTRNLVNMLLRGECSYEYSLRKIADMFEVSSESAEHRIKTIKGLIVTGDDKILLDQRRII